MLSSSEMEEKKEKERERESRKLVGKTKMSSQDYECTKYPQKTERFGVLESYSTIPANGTSSGWPPLCRAVRAYEANRKSKKQKPTGGKRAEKVAVPIHYSPHIRRPPRTLKNNFARFLNTRLYEQKVELSSLRLNPSLCIKWALDFV